jgi:BRCT domain type II-containing protein
VQIHFKDSRNKRLDITHPIKLDWTQTGLQTFGGETTKETVMVLKPGDYQRLAEAQSNEKMNSRLSERTREATSASDNIHEISLRNNSLNTSKLANVNDMLLESQNNNVHHALTEFSASAATATKFNCLTGLIFYFIIKQLQFVLIRSIFR